TLSSLTTVWVQGNNQVGNSTVSATAGQTNAGTILLESIDSSWSVTFNVTGTFTNSGQLLTTINTGGQRTITTGPINGSGSIDLTSAATLTADHIVQNGLSVAGAAIVRANGSNSGTSVIKSLAITGSGKLDLNDNDLIIDYAGSSQ